MNECTYKNYDELPLMLNVVQVAAVLGISRAGAYELVHSEGFPALKIGSRIVVPKGRLREWIDANTAQKKTSSFSELVLSRYYISSSHPVVNYNFFSCFLGSSLSLFCRIANWCYSYNYIFIRNIQEFSDFFRLKPSKPDKLHTE